MKEKNCGNCKHFRRHYIRYQSGRYYALHYGHCVKPRCKRRDMDHAACPYWEAQTDKAT